MQGASGDFRVDGYEIEGLLGASPTGELWLARQASSGQHVGLKRLHPKDADAHDEARRIHAVLGMLDHPSLLRVRELLSYGTEELVLVMDQAEGGTLEQLLMARPMLDPGEIVTISATIARALGAIHEHGLTHGDVTPESIVFTADGRPLLTDIGLSKLVERWDMMGMPGFDGGGAEGDGSAADDVRGLAAVAYTAASGAPLDFGQPRRPLHQVAPGVPSALSHAIEAGLQDNAAGRPDAAAFAGQVDAAAPRSAVRFPDAPEAGGPGFDNPFAIGAPQVSPGGPGVPGIAPPAPGGPPGRQGGHPGGPPGEQPASGGQQQPGGLFGQPGAGGAGPLSQPATQFTPGGPGPPGMPGMLDPHAGGVGDAVADDDERPRRKGGGVPWKLLGIGSAALVVLIVGVVAAIVLTGGPNDGPDNGGQPGGNGSPSNGGDNGTEPQTFDPPELGSPEDAEWADVFEELDILRERAFAAGDPSMLLDVYAPDAPPLNADNAWLYQASQEFDVERIEQVREPALKLTALELEEDRVVLDVTTELQTYLIVANDGTRFPQSEDERVKRRKFTLEPGGPAGWVISDMEDLEEAGG